MKVTSAATFKTYFQEGISTAYDDLTTGDAAVLLRLLLVTSQLMPLLMIRYYS